MTRREWHEDDPLNGPRCLTSALVWCVIMVVVILLVARMAHCAEAPDAPSMHRQRDHSVPVETYPPDQRMLVHNRASREPHRSWAARHPRLLGAIAIGAGVGVGAAVAISQRRGTCTERYSNGYTYVGTSPCPKD